MTGREQEPVGMTIIKGDLDEDELAKIVWTQISSPNPQQIRIEEGMGHMIYPPETIKRINKLPTMQKEEEAQEIIDDVSCADFVSIENPASTKTPVDIFP